MNLPIEYLARMRAQLNDGFDAYLAAMQQPARAALRVNTLKIAPEGLLSLLSDAPAPLPNTDDGFLLPDGLRPGYDPLHAAGLYYVQEASAQMPARLPRITPDMAVLDLCAAPGGKSTQLAARMQNTGVLVANEYVGSRTQALIGNLERMGVTNAIVTSMDAATLCRRLFARFDVVLCDAPCAGEGMFRKDPKAIAQWSPALVRSCAQRERQLLFEAASAVKPGGQLIYSTCSFSPEEDEETTERFLCAHPDFSLVSEQKLYPHTSLGEGQYMAHFMRDGERVPSVFSRMRSDRCKALEAFLPELSLPDGQVLRQKDGRVLLLPALPFPLDGLRVVRAGLLLGEDRGDRFEPAHALAMAAPQPFLRTEPLDADEAVRYLCGEALFRSAPKGWAAATYAGFSLGTVKSDGAVLKNHYPKGLRLLAPARKSV